MTACLIVRAEVPEGEREAFDTWYETEHLPDAKLAFGVSRAWRGWSDVDPSIHLAFYEFSSLEAARGITGSDALTRMVAEFDRMWADRVPRSREIMEIAQRI